MIVVYLLIRKYVVRSSVDPSGVPPSGPPSNILWVDNFFIHKSNWDLSSWIVFNLSSLLLLLLFLRDIIVEKLNQKLDYGSSYSYSDTFCQLQMGTFTQK